MRTLAAAALIALIGVFSLDDAAQAQANLSDFSVECPTVTEGKSGRMTLKADVGSGGNTYEVGVFTYTASASEDDYTPHSNTRFSFNESPAYFTFQTTEDDRVEGDETFMIGGNGYGAWRGCNVVIRDDDLRVTGIEMVSTPASGDTYLVGEDIEFTLTFSHEVDATGSGLGMTIGGEYQAARYRRGTGTATIVFGYTVQEGDKDSDGVSVRKGGYYADGSGAYGGLWNITAKGTDIPPYAVFAGIRNASGHKVDGTPPRFSNAVVTQDGRLVEVTFSEPITTPPLLMWLSDTLGLPMSLFYRAVFDVEVNSEVVVLTGASLSENTLSLSPEQTIGKDRRVKVGYNNIFARDAVGLFQDDVGHVLENFEKWATNNSTTVVPIGDKTTYVIAAPLEMTIAEGGTGSYSILLAQKPSGTVTVEVSVYPEGKLTPSVESLTFTKDDYDTPQNVTLTAGEDEDSYNFWTLVSHSSTGAHAGSLATIRVVIEDGD